MAELEGVGAGWSGVGPSYIGGPVAQSFTTRTGKFRRVVLSQVQIPMRVEFFPYGSPSNCVNY